MPVFSTNCHQAPGRAWRLRELAEEVRESVGSKSQLRLVSDSFYQFIQLVQTHISTWKRSNRMYIHYNVTAIPSPCCIHYSRQWNSQTRRSSALSHIEMRELENSNSKNTNKKQIRVSRMPHVTFADLYTISDSDRQRRNVSRPNAIS